MDLKAKITLAGVDYLYTMAGGKDCGDFHKFGGGVQHSIQAAHPTPDIPQFEVIFRPDADGAYVEVIFEFFKKNKPDNDNARQLFGGYSVVIMDGDTVLAGNFTSTPNHWWGSRWRWRSAERPIVMSPSQGIAARLLPPLGRDTVPGNLEGFDLTPFVYFPMGAAGLMQGMEQTGGRADIGDVHNVDGNWILNPSDPQAQRAMLDVGEGAGTVPWHYRDEDTGAPVSHITHPLFNGQWAANQYSVITNQSAQLINSGGYNTSGWTTDVAHQPQPSYVPYIATRDSYHLENLQFQVTACFAATAFWSNTATAYLPRDEDRGYWWSLRTLAMCLKATELAEADGPLPSWLMPSSYYRTLLQNQIDQFTSLFVNNPTLAGTYFSAGPELNTAQGWQPDFGNIVLETAVWMGFTELLAIAKWKIKNTIGRITAFPAFPSLYQGALCPAFPGRQIKGPDQPNQPLASDYDPDWATVYEHTAARTDIGDLTPAVWARLKADPTNGGVMLQANDDYYNNARSALALAVVNGNTDCVAPLAVADRYMAGHPQTARASFMSSVASLVVVPPVFNPAPFGVAPPPPAPGPSSGGSAPAPVITLGPVTPVPAPPAGFDPKNGNANIYVSGVYDLPQTGPNPPALNIIGDGTADVNLWSDIGFWKIGAMQPDGGIPITEDHSTGAVRILYGVARLRFGNEVAALPPPFQFAQREQLPQPDPPPAPPPAPEPAPQPQPENPPMADDALDQIKTKLAALETSNDAVTSASMNYIQAAEAAFERFRAKLAAVISPGTQVDPAQLQSILDELDTDKTKMDTAKDAINSHVAAAQQAGTDASAGG